MKKINMLLLTALLLTLFFSACTKSENRKTDVLSYQYQGNPQHTGEFKTEKKPSLNNLLWQKDFSKLIGKDSFDLNATSPVADQNSIYLGLDKYIYAIDFKGNIRWRIKLNQKMFKNTMFQPFFNTPAVYKNILYLGNIQGDFYAIDTIKGKILWIYKGKGELKNKGVISSSPLFYKNRIFFSQGNKLLSVNYLNGKVFWEKDGTSIPSFGLGKVYVSNSRNLYSYDLYSGKLVWKLSIPNTSTPVIYKKHVYIVADSGSTLFAIEGLKGKLLWKREIFTKSGDEHSISELAANEQGIYFYDLLLNSTYKYNHNGKQIWKASTTAGGFSPPVLLGDNLFEVSDNVESQNFISVTNILNGKLIKKKPIPSGCVSNLFITKSGNIIVMSGPKLLFYK